MRSYIDILAHASEPMDPIKAKANKLWYEHNRDKKKEYNREYYEQNKEYWRRYYERLKKQTDFKRREITGSVLSEYSYDPVGEALDRKSGEKFFYSSDGKGFLTGHQEHGINEYRKLALERDAAYENYGRAINEFESYRKKYGDTKISEISTKVSDAGRSFISGLTNLKDRVVSSITSAFSKLKSLF